MKTFKQLRNESVIDIPRRTYAPNVFDDEDTKNPKIKATVKAQIDKQIKEFEKEYNKIENYPKSDKTLYRYLKTLQDANLVKTAGQRVILGKTATEKLFSRTAYAFHLVNEQIDFWQTSDGIKLTKTLGTILQPLIPNKKVNIEKLGQFIEKLSSERINMLEQMFSSSDPSLLEGISNYNWQRFTLFYNLGGLFGLLLTDPNKVTDLTKCFE